MGELKVKDKEVVIPGQILAAGMDYLPNGGAFREGENIIATQLGLVSVNGRVIKLIPLTGKYVPKIGDTIIGKVVDIGFYGWMVDIRCAYSANLQVKEATEYIEKTADLSSYYDYNDVISAKIIRITRTKSIDLSMKGPGFRKLRGGKIIEVTPTKVPRIIGKQGSMINMIKELTGCKITVGQNGIVWISGLNPDKETLATEAIMKIENEAHLDGLTDKIKALLEKSK